LASTPRTEHREQNDVAERRRFRGCGAENLGVSLDESVEFVLTAVLGDQEFVTACKPSS
jgi:hypothetical protein